MFSIVQLKGQVSLFQITARHATQTVDSLNKEANIPLTMRTAHLVHR